MYFTRCYVEIRMTETFFFNFFVCFEGLFCVKQMLGIWMDRKRFQECKHLSLRYNEMHLLSLRFTEIRITVDTMKVRLDCIVYERTFGDDAWNEQRQRPLCRLV